MSRPFSSEFSVDNILLALFQNFFRPQESDGVFLVWAKELLVALLILTSFWLLAQLVCWLMNKWGRKLTSLTGADLSDRLIQRVIPHVSRLLTILGIYLALLSLPFHEKIVLVISGILFIVLVIIVFNLIYHSFDELLKWYIASVHEGSDPLISHHMLPIAEKLAVLFLMGAALIVILKHFNYDIFSLVTALGIGSLAIGMAAKDTMAHMISGFTLMLDRPFQIGDRIKLINGQIGDVIDIGLRSTKIQGLDSTIMIIPNSDLCNSTLINMVRPTSITQGHVTLGVGYASDVDHVKELLVTIAGENPDVLEKPAPQALFTSFGESALNMSLLFWVSAPALAAMVTDQLNCTIISRFRESGIEIPFPIRTVIMEKGLDPICPTE